MRRKLKKCALVLAGTVLIPNVAAGGIAQYEIYKNNRWQKQYQLDHPDATPIGNCGRLCAESQVTWRLNRVFDRIFNYNSPIASNNLTNAALYATAPGREIMYRLNGLGPAQPSQYVR